MTMKFINQPRGWYVPVEMGLEVGNVYFNQVDEALAYENILTAHGIIHGPVSPRW